jgi:multidrug resistance protein
MSHSEKTPTSAYHLREISNNETITSNHPAIATKEMDLKPLKENDDISITPTNASTRTTPDLEETPPTPAQRPPTLSRTISVIPEAVIVERRHRRGLFGRFTLIPEVLNSYHYSRKTKWLITVIVAICAMAAPMGSAIVMPVLQDIAKAFGASHTIANMSVAVYMLSMSLFPLWWSSFSETVGRRTIYIVSFTMFVLFAILSAVSTNITMLIVMRTFSGGAAASVQAVGAGSVSDMWEPRERGRAMSVFYLGPLCGPLIGPIIGGILGKELGWRSTQWFLVIYGGLTLIMIIFLLPETLPSNNATPPQPQQPSIPSIEKGEKQTERPHLSRISTRQSVHLKSKTIAQSARRIFIDPLIVITWLRYPPVALTVYYASITFGALYFLNISIQSTFSAAPYNFSTLIVGTSPFIPLAHTIQHPLTLHFC